MTENDTEKDIEFLPTDDDVDTLAEAAGAEDAAVHVEDREQRAALTGADVEAEPGADELETAADDEAADAGWSGTAEEHEEDVAEILQRHYGIVEEEPGEGASREDEQLRPLAPDEFVCRNCFMRRPASQRSDPVLGICVDCADGG